MRVAAVVMCVGLAVGLSPAAGVAAVSGADVGGAGVADARSVLDLSHGWRFQRGEVAGAALPGYADTGWEQVSIPHTWNAVDGLDTTAGYYRGVGWYRRVIVAPAAPVARSFFVEFDGVNATAEVYLDGRAVGRHAGGYSRFRVPLAGLVPGQPAVLAVRVDNGKSPDVAPLSTDWTEFGGIYRGVRLLAVNPDHVDLLDDGGPGVYLRVRDPGRTATIETATVDVETKLRNDSGTTRRVRAVTVLRDASGHPVAVSPGRPVTLTGSATVRQTLTIEHPHRWRGLADPYLYSAQVRLVDADTRALLDTVTQPLGIRTVAVDPQRGFLLNGAPYRLYGVDMHQAREPRGSAVTRADLDQDLDFVKEIGATSVRLVHYQHAPYVYERADRDGLVLWTEIPFMHLASDTAGFATNVHQQLRELVKQNFNHPSVAFWSIGNEPTFKPGPDPNPLLVQLDDEVRALDPSRIDAYATCCVADDDVSVSHTTATGYHRYEGWYFGTSDWFGPWADQNHAAQPGKAFAVTEYGAGASINLHAANPQPSQTPYLDPHTEEYQAIVHEQHWRQIAARPYLFASWAYVLFDVPSDGREDGDRPGVNDKGLVTQDRKVRKDAFYFYKANWSRNPTLHITSRRFTTRTDPVTDIKVYANTGPVTLFLNGIRVGTLPPDDLHTAVWHGVRLAPGENTVVAVSGSAGTQIRDVVHWTVTG
jgi:beta-galactosidase